MLQLTTTSILRQAKILSSTTNSFEFLPYPKVEIIIIAITCCGDYNIDTLPITNMISLTELTHYKILE